MLPPNVIIDFAYSIAMFLVALTGLRYVLKDQWGIDILDFSKMPAKIAGGMVSLILLVSIYRTVADPNKAKALGRAFTGREYNVATAEQAAAASDTAQSQIAKVNASVRTGAKSNVGKIAI